MGTQNIMTNVKTYSIGMAQPARFGAEEIVGNGGAAITIESDSRVSRGAIADSGKSGSDCVRIIAQRFQGNTSFSLMQEKDATELGVLKSDGIEGTSFDRVFESK
jgi:hypothetical protein